MARRKFDAMQYQYTLGKLEGARRWAFGEPLFSHSDEMCAQQVLIELFNGRDPFSPLPPGFNSDSFVKKLSLCFDALFRIYRGELKSVVCLDFGKSNSSALDEWLVYSLSTWFGIKNSFDDEIPLIRELSPDINLPRTNAETVEIMLRILEIGRIRQFGSIKLCGDEEEFPPKRIKH